MGKLDADESQNLKIGSWVRTLTRTLVVRPQERELYLVLVVLCLALLIRILIEVYLVRAGYYYGEDPDSFWRLGLAWQWARSPFFDTYYWVPLQFAINGTTFKLLSLFLNQSTMLVPIFWNHVFFVVSLLFVYLAATRLGGRLAGMLGVLLASTLTESIWTTYSGLSEPLTVACYLAVAYCLLLTFDSHAILPQYFVLGGGIAAGVASANHYLGWALILVVVPQAAYVIVAEARIGDITRPDFAFPMAASLLVMATFPLAWLVDNWRVHGSPLYFLQKAQSYHPWVSRMSTFTRLAELPHLFVSTAPYLVAIALVVIPLVALRNPKSLWLIAPPIAYLSILTISSVKAFGVADMHDRYGLVPIWGVLPFVACGAAVMIQSARKLSVVGGVAVIGLPAIAGLTSVTHFYNWVDGKSRQLTSVIEAGLQAHKGSFHVLLENEPCLYPIGGIADGLSRPEMVNTMSPTDLVADTSRSRRAIRNADLIVLTDPLTYTALADRVGPYKRIGDYAVAFPSEHLSGNPSPLPLPEPWKWITRDSFHYVDTNSDVYFAFDPDPSAIGDSIGLRASLKVEPNSCQILHANVQDRYEHEGTPWAAVQQLVVNDAVVWSHDLSGDKACGWLPVDTYLMPTTTRLNVELRVIALTGPDLRVDWRRLSLTGVRDLSIVDCP